MNENVCKTLGTWIINIQYNVLIKVYICRDLRDKTMAESVYTLYIPNENTQNHPVSRLKLVFKTFEHSTYWISQSKITKVSKVVKATTKKT